MLLAPADKARVDPFFTVVSKADQPLSLAGQSPAGTAAPSGTMPVPLDALAVDPFFAAAGWTCQPLSLARHRSPAHPTAEDGDLDVLAGDP
jgi:hypothetical protein